jgi:hypothetical protein
MNRNVAVILKLVFPRSEREEYEFSVSLTREELPHELWHETGDHVAGAYLREGNTQTYVFQGRMNRDDAVKRGIQCF